MVLKKHGKENIDWHIELENFKVQVYNVNCYSPEWFSKIGFERKLSNEKNEWKIQLH